MALPHTIAAAVDKVARQSIGKDWSLYAALIHHWPEIVGGEYAKVCSPVKISFPQGKTEGDKWASGRRTDGVLHIRLPQGLAMECSFLTDQIKQRISVCFGYQSIERIAFETYYAAPEAMVNLDSADAQVDISPPLDIQGIDDEELKNALEEYGKRLIRAEKAL